MTIEYRMYLKFLQKPRYLCWFKTSQALWSVVKKTRLNSSKDNFIAKRSRFSTKWKLSILSNFLFPFVSFISVFSILKCKTLVLKTTTWWARQPGIFWWMTFTEVSNPFLLPPSKWLTIRLLWGRGYGWFSSVRIFSPTYNGVRFLFQHYSWWAIFFFSVQNIIFPRYFLASFFLLEIRLQDIFSWNHP